jgi:hypothetical protein
LSASKRLLTIDASTCTTSSGAEYPGRYGR